MSLESLPVEILDYIVSLISIPEDLLSFALTSQAFAQFIVPRHTHSRRLRCKPTKSLLKKLVEDESLTSRLWEVGMSDLYEAYPCYRKTCIPERLRSEDVMTAVVIPAETEGGNTAIMQPIMRRRMVAASNLLSNLLLRFPRKPPFLGEATSSARTNQNFPYRRLFHDDLDKNTCLSALAAVVKGAPYLERFTLDVVTPPTNALKELAEALAGKEGYLRELHLSVRILLSDPLNQMVESFSKIRGLAKLYLELRHPVEFNNPSNYEEKLVDMLLSCTDLEDVHLIVVRYRQGRMLVPRLLKDANWPKLQRLSIEGSLVVGDDALTEEENAAILADFYRRHDKIESLAYGAQQCLLPGCAVTGILPNLRSISFRQVVALDLSKLVSLEICRRLESVVTWSDNIGIEVLKTMPSLLYFSGYVDWNRLEEFTAAIPQIKRLHANPSRGLHMNLSQRPAEIKKTMRAILQLKQLTHLSGLLTGQMFTYKVIKESNLLRRISRLPKLEYIYVPNQHDAEQWIRISRNAKGNCDGFEWLEEGIVEHPYNWGNFFQGFVRKY